MWSSYTPAQPPLATACTSHDVDQPLPVSDSSQPPQKKKCIVSPETKLRHATENVVKATAAVQDFEGKLNVARCWVPGDAEWKKAGMMVNKRQYQRCLDELERLVISRMFELTKMNMSQTGDLKLPANIRGLTFYDHRLQTP